MAVVVDVICVCVLVIGAAVLLFDNSLFRTCYFDDYAAFSPFFYCNRYGEIKLNI